MGKLNKVILKASVMLFKFKLDRETEKQNCRGFNIDCLMLESFVLEVLCIYYSSQKIQGKMHHFLNTQKILSHSEIYS